MTAVWVGAMNSTCKLNEWVRAHALLRNTQSCISFLLALLSFAIAILMMNTAAAVAVVDVASCSCSCFFYSIYVYIFSMRFVSIIILPLVFMDKKKALDFYSSKLYQLKHHKKQTFAFLHIYAPCAQHENNTQGNKLVFRSFGFLFRSFFFKFFCLFIFHAVFFLSILFFSPSVWN